MKIADLRVQTSTPTAPSAGVIGLYANSQGVLVTETPDGTVSGVGSIGLNSYTRSQVVTGGASYLITGSYWGPTIGGALPATGLSVPSVWVQFHLSGTNYAIPAYALR